MINNEFPRTQPKPEISNDLKFIDKAIELHDKVFESNEQSVYNDSDEWLRRIDNGGFFTVVNEGDSVKGFTVCDVTSEGEFKIWLAGVDPEARGQGYWSQMYEDVITYAKSKDYEHILLNTFPEKFPTMFSFLQKMNAEIYKEEVVGGFKKVYARIKI